MILFTKVSLPHGWLGNMSPHPVTYGGVVCPTAEHLFQVMRFAEDSAVRDAIRGTRSPMGAKMVAKRNKDSMLVAPRSAIDLTNMHECLLAKLEAHPELRSMLLETGGELLVEDVSKRPSAASLFWGLARTAGGEWRGENHLGRLWMELRGADLEQLLAGWRQGQDEGLSAMANKG